MGPIDTNAAWIRDFATVVADIVASRQSPSSDTLSQREAGQLYGVRWIAAQERAGRIHPVRTGTARNSRLAYSRTELDTVLAAERYTQESLISTRK